MAAVVSVRAPTCPGCGSARPRRTGPTAPSAPHATSTRTPSPWPSPPRTPASPASTAPAWTPVFLASTSLPYVEKQTASLVAVAADLRSDIVTIDVAHSLRAATPGPSPRRSMASPPAPSERPRHRHRPAPRRPRLGRRSSTAATPPWRSSSAPASPSSPSPPGPRLANDILDVWRSDGDRLLAATPEEHFRYEEGYLHAVSSAAPRPSPRRPAARPSATRAPSSARPTPAATARQPAASASSRTASCRCPPAPGAPAPPWPSSSSPRPSRPPPPATNSSSSTTATAPTPSPSRLARPRGRPRRQTPPLGQLARTTPVEDYYDFLRWRGLGPVSANGARVAPAPHALCREQDEVLRFHGMRCRACGMVQYPAQRVCVRCQAEDQAEPVRMADGGATLFSYSMDYVAATPRHPARPRRRRFRRRRPRHDAPHRPRPRQPSPSA